MSADNLPPSAAAAEGERLTLTVTLRTPGGEVCFECPRDQFILHEALARGLDLPYLCLQGWCVTCAARLESGDVDASAARRYYPEDRQAGFVLLCTARPLSDVVAVTHQKEQMRQHRLESHLPVPRG